MTSNDVVGYIYNHYISHQLDHFKSMYKQERFDKGDGVIFLIPDLEKGLYVYANNLDELDQYMEPRVKDIFLEYFKSTKVNKDTHMMFMVMKDGGFSIFDIRL